jgi:hypothetical protein
MPGRTGRLGAFRIGAIGIMAVIAAMAWALTGWSAGRASGHAGGAGPRASSCPTARTTPAPGVGPVSRVRQRHLTWMLTRSAMSQVMSDPVVRAGLCGSQVYQLLQPGQKPLGWAGSIPVVTFTAVGDLTPTVASSWLPAGTRALLYDPEAWSFTPAAEQHDLASAVSRAKAAAHGHGLALIVAPGLNLVTRHRGGRGPRWWRFLDMNLIGAAARHADVIELQAQSLERDARVYEQFVRQAAAQARAANPHVRVLAGLSTNPPGPPVISEQLVAAIKATEQLVGGYWLNIPGKGPRCPTCNPPRPDIGRAVLRAVL